MKTTSTGPLPNYVLLNGKLRLGPELLPLDSGSHHMAIYGFSGKPAYERFRQNSPLALTPYPLVKGYLRNQLTESADATHLVIIDATGPQDPQLGAATMDAVLEAHERQTKNISLTIRLALDSNSQAYRVEQTSAASNPWPEATAPDTLTGGPGQPIAPFGASQ